MEIGMAAKEYLIEIEVRKYTPKMIRSYRNNLNPTISGKMLHKLKNGKRSITTRISKVE